MANAPLVYKDYRPIRRGDIGWTPERQKARNYYSPSQRSIIPLRQFQKLARGVSYPEYVRQRERRGIPQKKYRRVKPKIIAPPGKRKGVDYQKRVSQLQDAFARRLSEDYDIELTWDELPDFDKTIFWIKYHDLVDRFVPPTIGEVRDEFYDYFDIEYDQYGDLDYGETP